MYKIRLKTQKGGMLMEKGKLNEDLTEKISGGLYPKYKDAFNNIGSFKIGVKCAKCGRPFRFFMEEVPEGVESDTYWDSKNLSRVCPVCGYTNSGKELGLSEE